MTGTQWTERTASRRAVVAATGAAGLAAALTACSGDSEGNADGQKTAKDATASSAPAEAAGGHGAGAVLGKTSDVPEGGGMVFKDHKVVVVQPTAGEFKAFSSTCTHAGCQVKDVSGGTINCPCHGSKFAVADGSVKGGPAPKPLPAVKITIDGDSVKLA
jgi:Rieske Fe-S protein